MADLSALASIVGDGHVAHRRRHRRRLHPRRGAHRHAAAARSRSCARPTPTRSRPSSRGRPTHGVPGHGARLGHRACPAPASRSADGLLVSFERMAEILEIDTDNHVAVVQPGVTLAPARRGPRSRTASSTPCSPARARASLGGNVATNAGGMRAVRYGVTRHQVLGLTAVLGTGEVHPHRRQVREGHLRLRPHPAHHRLGGHAGPGHRGHAAAPPPARPRQHDARPVPHRRRGGRLHPA